MEPVNYFYECSLLQMLLISKDEFQVKNAKSEKSASSDNQYNGSFSHFTKINTTANII